MNSHLKKNKKTSEDNIISEQLRWLRHIQCCEKEGFVPLIYYYV